MYLHAMCRKEKVGNKWRGGISQFAGHARLMSSSMMGSNPVRKKWNLQLQDPQHRKLIDEGRPRIFF